MKCFEHWKLSEWGVECGQSEKAQGMGARFLLEIAALLASPACEAPLLQYHTAISSQKGEESSIDTSLIAPAQIVQATPVLRKANSRYQIDLSPGDRLVANLNLKQLGALYVVYITTSGLFRLHLRDGNNIYNI